jgi:hypothetical protein
MQSVAACVHKTRSSYQLEPAIKCHCCLIYNNAYWQRRSVARNLLQQWSVLLRLARQCSVSPTDTTLCTYPVLSEQYRFSCQPAALKAMSTVCEF